MTRLGRALVVALTVCLVAVVAAGCGGSSGDKSSSSDTSASGGGSSSGKGLKVGFVYVSPLPGSAWSTAWDETRKDLESKYGAKTTVVQPIPENPDVVSTLQDLIRKGNKLIFATAFGYQPFVAQVAQQNPKVNFVVTGPWVQKGDRPKNVSSVYGNLWEVRYLTGIVAASMSKTKTLGFVSAFSIPSVVAGINGFELGAKSVDPSIKTKVVFTSNWYNPPQSTQAAETLAKGGADIIAKHEDSIGPLLGAKAAGVYGIGSEADTSASAPETYLTGSVYDWKAYSEKKYQQTVDGNFTNDEVNGGLKEGIVKLGPLNSAVPADVKAKVEQTQSDIESGKLVIFKGPIKDNTGKEALAAGKEWVSPADVYTNMTFFVDGIVGKIQK
jgi:basic membrane protein A